MITPGDRVTAPKASFEGRVLGPHGLTSAGSAGKYWSLPENPNVAVYAVLNEATGEIRYFTAAALTPSVERG